MPVVETIAEVKEPEDAGTPETSGDSESEREDPDENGPAEDEEELPPEDREVTISFIGDILFDDEYAVTANLIQRGGKLSSSISQDALDIMNASDIMVVNNEFPYTAGGAPQEEKQFTFRADPSTVSYLKDMGADVAILANNHVYDYGSTGLNDSLDVLNGAGIVPLGAGNNIDEASAPAYFEINGIKIALIAATQIERQDHPNTIGATADHGGTFRCWTGELIYEKIAEAKQNADFVIACIHWGTEKVTEPDHYQLNQAPKLEEAGADLIVGDHPHVLQGFTYYNDTPCIYSLGNFWFNSSALDTGILTATFTSDGIKSLQFIPARQEGCSTKLVHGAEAGRILSEMRALSPGVSIDEEGYVTKQ